MLNPMTPLAARATSPASRRLVLTPAPVKDDPRIRRYRLARMRLETPRAARGAGPQPVALGS